MMDELKWVLEKLTKISPAMVFIGTPIALWQLIIAKNSLIVRSKREAVSLAADKCGEFGSKLLPKRDECFQQRLIASRWKLRDKKFSSNSLEDVRGGDAWIQDLRAKGGLLKVLSFLNDMEALSMYFANGAADEKVACPVIGDLFCQWVEELAPLLVQLREQTLTHVNSGPYQNTVNLYDIWVDRLSKGKLQKEIDELQGKKREIKDKGIRPIGL